MKYFTPKKYYYRIHHIRPRFKKNPESVLFFLSNALSTLAPAQKAVFNKTFNRHIRMYPGNANKTDKSIANWRTEISGLFSLIQYEKNGRICIPSKMSTELSKNQDLVEFFRKFLITFQYPGGHLKPHVAINMIRNGIKFQPAIFILNLLKIQYELGSEKFGITGDEAAHFIFNDLRVTALGSTPEEVIHRIEIFRKDYSGFGLHGNYKKGDTVRYAKDILDYMIFGGLLTKEGDRYTINNNYSELIDNFLSSARWFHGYDIFYDTDTIPKPMINELVYSWHNYVNDFSIDIDLRADVFKHIEELHHKGSSDASTIYTSLKSSQDEEDRPSPYEIGRKGENYIELHEKNKLINEEKNELAENVEDVSAQKIGYDIHSFFSNADEKLIEVKTTISTADLVFHQFTLTSNEWRNADLSRESYFVYRLIINKDKIRLFIIQDPVGKYRNDDDDINIIPTGDLVISFKETAGYWEKLTL